MKPSDIDLLTTLSRPSVHPDGSCVVVAATRPDLLTFTAQSPLAHVGAVTTPTLVIHSENDLRCPLEQGQRYYAALQRQGTPAELLIFPGENHELSRAGRPRHRAERFEHILSWWARHLPTPTNQPTPTQ